MQSEVHFENIKQQIQTELRKAKELVFVAVAWFTDDDLFEELVILSRKGIQIQLLLNEDEINTKSGLDYPILYRNGGMIYFVNASEILMHNKFCIIDKKTVLNGSFNWTRKASTNLENLTIIRDISTSNKFLEQFDLLKNKAKSYFEEIGVNHSNFVKSSMDENIDYEQLIDRAEKRKENGNFLASLIDFKKAIDKMPEKKSDLLFEIAFCQAELKDYENAIINYTKYLELNPKSTATLNNRALIYENQNNFDLAIKDFTKAIEIDNNDPLFYRNRARVQTSLMSRFENKKKNTGMDLMFLPTSVTKIGNKEFLDYKDNFWYSGNLEKLIRQGIKDYLKILELDKTADKVKIYESIAEIHYELSDFHASIVYYSKIISLDSQNHYANYSRGWCYYLLENFEKAISDIQNALKIAPENKNYREAFMSIKKTRRKPKNWFK